MKKQQKKYISIKEFSTSIRIFHWIRAFCIFGLIFTGFYIAIPFLTPMPDPQPTGFLNAKIRSVHEILGFLIIGASIFRLYLFFFARSSHPERESIPQAFSVKLWIEQIKAYLFIGRHPHIKGAYNPIQVFSYFMLGILLLGLVLTGLALYAEVYHEGLGAICASLFGWVDVVCGGIANVRWIHHILMWAIIIFIPIHIYMVVLNSVRWPNGGADGIISGYHYAEIKEDK